MALIKRNMMLQRQLSLDDFAPLMEKSRQNVLRLRVDDIEHYLFYDEESEIEKAVWINGDFECRIAGAVTQEEMEHIIDSVYGG